MRQQDGERPHREHHTRGQDLEGAVEFVCVVYGGGKLKLVHLVDCFH